MNQTTLNLTTRQELLKRLNNTSRLMVKIGSNRIVCTDTLRIHQDWVNDFAVSLITLDKDFAITASGAIGLAQVETGLPRPSKDDIPGLQAFAAIGQSTLTDIFKVAFKPHGMTVGQLLLTKKELNTEEALNNTRNTMNALRRLNQAIQINENDTVATIEIKIGDNDRLSAWSAIADQSQLLVLVSDIDGFYTADPRKDPNAEHIAYIDDFSRDMLMNATGARGNHSKGGMETKIEAARIAAQRAIPTIILNGEDAGCLTKLFNGNDRYTYIDPKAFEKFKKDPRELKEIALDDSFWPHEIKIPKIPAAAYPPHAMF